MFTGIKKRIKIASALTGDKKQKALLELISAAKAKHLPMILKEAGEDDLIKSTILEKAKNYLESDKTSEVWDAMDTIDLMEFDQKLDLISKKMKNSNKNIRVHAISILKKIKDERVIELLINALDDESRTVKWNAVNALGDIGDKRAVEPLIKLINQHYLVSCDAVKALGKLKDIRAVEPLILGYSYHKSNNDVIVCGYIVDALSEIGGIGDNIDKVGRWLKYDVIPEYDKILIALSKTKDKRAIPYIIDANRPIISFSTFKLKVDCLGEIGDIAAADTIINWVVYASKPQAWDIVKVQSVGVNGLLKLPQDEVLRLFISHSLQLLSNSSYLMHSILTDFFEVYTLSVTDRAAVPVLCSMLNENKAKICCAAAKTLGRLKDESSIPFLQEAAQNSNKKISKAANEALDNINN